MCGSKNKWRPENPKAKRQQTNLSNNWFISLSPLASIFLENEHYGRIHCKFHFFSSARKHWVTVCNSQASSFEHGHARADDFQINLRHMQWKPRKNEWRSAIAKQTHLSTVMRRRLISKSTSPFLSLPFPSFPFLSLPFPSLPLHPHRPHTTVQSSSLPTRLTN